MSLELIYKAVVVAKGDKPKKGHNLSRLASEAGIELDSQDEAALQILEEYLRWAGRYPIPLELRYIEELDVLRRQNMFDTVKIGRLDIQQRNDFLKWDHFTELWTDGMNVFYRYFDSRSK